MRVNPAIGWHAVLVLAGLPAAAFAATVSGVVVDPQNLPVPQAIVTVACAGGSARAVTDRAGHFAIAAPGGSDCVVSVERDGFGSYQQLLADPSSSLTIRLPVAAFSQQLTVEGRTGAGGVSLSADAVDLRSLAADTAGLIRYVQQLSGSAARTPAVYVDGLPADALPPLDLIAEISVHSDPFSVEYGDGVGVAVEIITRAPSRTFRMFSGGGLPPLGGGNVLADDAGETSRSLNAGAMGPVPRLPVTFAATATVMRSSQAVPMVIHLPEFRAAGDTAAASTAVTAGSLGLFIAPSESFRARISIRESRTHASNAGVGGITREDAGSSSSFDAREIRATATTSWRGVRIENGGIVNDTRSETRANSADRGIAIGGDVVIGGASMLTSDRRSVRWTTKHVVRPSSRRWLVGVSAAQGGESHRRTPNPLGSFYFSDVDAYRAAMAGEPTGTWQVDRGDGLAETTALSVSPFAQLEIARTAAYSVSAGIRADYRSDFGTVMSPRLSTSLDWAGTLLRTGVGVFARSVSDAMLLAIAERSGSGLTQFVASRASLTPTADPALREMTAVRSRLADDLRRPRGIVWRTSAERAMAGVITAVEYEFGADGRLLGSDRVATASGWEDLVESNRGRVRHHVHLRGARLWRGHQFTVDYDVTRARDNTDGAFSFPEHAGAFAAEWARSAILPPHEVNVMAALTLPAGVSLTVSDVWRSGAPFNVTTGADPDGRGLALDRGGRARNSGDGPSFHSLSLYAHRRIRWPRMFKRSGGLSIAVHADNVLNSRNYMSLGSVAGSDTFGAPLAAYPARSLRLLLNVD